MTETKDPNPTPAEVDDFLAKRGTGPIDLSLKAEDVGAASSEEKSPGFEAAKDPRYNPETNTEPSLLDRLHSNTRPFTPEQIALTPAEKELYLKSVLFDQPVEFVLSLPGQNITAKLSSRNTFESSVVFRAVEQEIAAGSVKDPAVYMTYLQQYSACFQLREFCGLPLPHALRFETPLPMPEAVNKLNEAHSRSIKPMNAPRWNIALRLLSLFEAKLAAAADGLVNGDFSGPAS